MSPSSTSSNAERVMVLPGTVDQGSQTLQVPSLPLSAKGQSMCLLGEQGVILEVQQYKTLYSSWLIGDRFSADGGLFLCTALDPLFVLLPLLEARPAQGATGGALWVAVDELLDSQTDKLSAPARSALLESARPQLECIGDLRDVDGDVFFRLNNDKVLAWLLCKHEQCKAALAQGPLVGMDDKSADAYAAAFLSEYLSQSCASRLTNHLGVELSTPTETGASKHQQPSSNNSGGDKRTKFVDAKEAAKELQKAKAQAARAQAKQAAEAKAVKGMKKMTQFFAVKQAPS